VTCHGHHGHHGIECGWAGTGAAYLRGLGRGSAAQRLPRQPPPRPRLDGRHGAHRGVLAQRAALPGLPPPQPGLQHGRRILGGALGYATQLAPLAHVHLEGLAPGGTAGRRWSIIAEGARRVLVWPIVTANLGGRLCLLPSPLMLMLMLMLISHRPELQRGDHRVARAGLRFGGLIARIARGLSSPAAALSVSGRLGRPADVVAVTVSAQQLQVGVGAQRHQHQRLGWRDYLGRRRLCPAPRAARSEGGTKHRRYRARERGRAPPGS
jgi:hypothetical protein